ncbi:zinc metallopeptidase [Streptococcus pneumoniae]|nr:zinc metallopeptidase [Streptococcus pneumoniae]
MDLSNKASNLRKKLGADGESPIDIFKLVQKIENLTLVFYRDLTRNHDSNKIIGKGEGASISLAKKHNGILGSNNLRDVKPYVEEFSLEHMTTGDILIEAFKA